MKGKSRDEKFEAIAERLRKLFPLLASDQAGEVGATVAAVGRTLRTVGLDWHDLTIRICGEGQPVAQRPPPQGNEASAGNDEVVETGDILTRTKTFAQYRILRDGRFQLFIFGFWQNYKDEVAFREREKGYGQRFPRA